MDTNKKTLRSFAFAIYFLTLLVAPFSLKGHADYYPSYNGASGGFNYNYGQGSASSSSSSSSKVISLELDPKKILNSDFRVAAREGRVSDVRKLIKAGADVNSQSESGETALMYSARQCSLPTAHMLIAAHADVNKRDRSGQSALMVAVLSSCEPLVKIILKDPSVALNTLDDSRHTAMDYSVESTEVEVDGPSLKILQLLKKAQHHRVRDARADAHVAGRGRSHHQKGSDAYVKDA